MTPMLAFGPPHGADWIWILLIVLIVFGPKKLPELARGLGRSLGEFKKAKEEFERELHASANEMQSTAQTPKTPAQQEPAPALMPPAASKTEEEESTVTAKPASNTVPQSKNA